MSNTIIVYYFTPSEDFLGRLAGLSTAAEGLVIDRRDRRYRL